MKDVIEADLLVDLLIEEIDHWLVIVADSLRSLLIKMKTSCSFKLIFLIAFWDKDFTQS